MKRISPIFIAALAFLLAPYLLLLPNLKEWTWPDWEEFTWALKNSIFQATGSSLLALVMGSFICLGLIRIKEKWQGMVSILLLTPLFFPTLIVLLSFLHWMNPFPVGFVGIILIQGFISSGLVAVLMTRHLQNQFGSLSEVALVMGASKWQLARALFPLLRPSLISWFLAVWATSFASFSIPFVVGGGRATTLEILIFEKIRITQSWSEAVSLSYIQLGIMFFFFFLPSWESPLLKGRHQVSPGWGSRAAVLILVAYLLMMWLPLIEGIPESFQAIQQIPGINEEIALLLVPSLAVSLLVGLSCFFLFCLFIYGGGKNRVSQLMRAWIAPSTTLIGMALLFSPEGGSWGSYLAALLFLFFPSLFRLGMDRRLESLSTQVEVAQTMGASNFLIWRRLLIPQLLPTAAFLSGLASFWALGEFALGRVMIGGNQTWGLLAESLMSSYRIEAGLGVAFLILLSGGGLVFLFWSCGDVARRKLSSSIW